MKNIKEKDLKYIKQSNFVINCIPTDWTVKNAA